MSRPMTPQEAFTEAVLRCNKSENELARRTGYSQHAIWHARKRGRPTAEMCIKIERATGVAAALLRPDIFNPTGD
jgi:DNA-binding transcriptional regulator YdaS (Cro superfamily)